jgi:hypothetical protein
VEKYVTSKQDYSEIPIYGFFLGQWIKKETWIKLWRANLHTSHNLFQTGNQS